MQATAARPASTVTLALDRALLLDTLKGRVERKAELAYSGESPAQRKANYDMYYAAACALGLLTEEIEAGMFDMAVR